MMLYVIIFIISANNILQNITEDSLICRCLPVNYSLKDPGKPFFDRCVDDIAGRHTGTRSANAIYVTLDDKIRGIRITFIVVCSDSSTFYM